MKEQELRIERWRKREKKREKEEDKEREREGKERGREKGGSCQQLKVTYELTIKR